LANLFAIFLQSLAIKLGTVSGLNLAEACRAFLPRWLNYVLYGFAEIAIIATDIAEACKPHHLLPFAFSVTRGFQ
jgi:metal iron transporter